MSSRRVLVVAPDRDLRRSLCFVLQAEGYVVTAFAELPPIEAAGAYDATVLHHRASVEGAATMLAFCRGARPVVLLAVRPPSWLAEVVFRIVPTPLMGDALIAAVNAAAALGASPK